jgi:hypothetical protein
VMGSGWDWIRFGLIRYVNRHDLFYWLLLVTGC